MNKYMCHVCGYPNLKEPPWGLDGKSPSYNICPCCGVEFGYEDATEQAKIRFRNDWLSQGAQWFNEEERPKDWNLQKQLENIKVDYEGIYEK